MTVFQGMAQKVYSHAKALKAKIRFNNIKNKNGMPIIEGIVFNRVDNTIDIDLLIHQIHKFVVALIIFQICHMAIVKRKILVMPEPRTAGNLRRIYIVNTIIALDTCNVCCKHRRHIEKHHTACKDE